MATKAATKRLGKEAQLMDKDPPPFCYGRPREDNVLEWHFILRGPPDTPYHGGEYWGQLIFPPDYPFKPPGIKMSTPSGRFHTDSKICTSMSDFHPGSWNPAWSVANILVGLLSFMCADEMTTGSVMASHADRRTLAQRSHAFNITQPRFKRLFPDFAGPTLKDVPNMGDKKESSQGSSAASADKSQSQSQSSSASPTKAPNALDSGNLTSREKALPTSSPSASTPAQRRPSMRPAPAPQQTAAQVQGLAQPRSRAIFPLLVALAAYLFISRLTSLIGGSTGSGPSSAPAGGAL